MMITSYPTGNDPVKLNRRLNLRRTGFTFLEILMAISILSIGAVYILRCFFTSASAMKYVNNRAKADLVISEKMWETKNYIDKNNIDNEYVNIQSVNANPVFNYTVRVNKIPVFLNLYSMDLTLSWKEGAKEIVLRHSAYVRRAT
jgi:prepilin-type N-terminal cleavage/methylation domain-containing protein